MQRRICWSRRADGWFVVLLIQILACYVLLNICGCWLRITHLEDNADAPRTPYHVADITFSLTVIVCSYCVSFLLVFFVYLLLTLYIEGFVELHKAFRGMEEGGVFLTCLSGGKECQ